MIEISCLLRCDTPECASTDPGTVRFPAPDPFMALMGQSAGVREIIGRPGWTVDGEKLICPTCSVKKAVEATQKAATP